MSGVTEANLSHLPLVMSPMNRKVLIGGIGKCYSATTSERVPLRST